MGGVVGEVFLGNRTEQSPTEVSPVEVCASEFQVDTIKRVAAAVACLEEVVSSTALDGVTFNQSHERARTAVVKMSSALEYILFI